MLNHVNKRGPKEQSHTGEKKSITSQPWPLAQAMTCHWTMLMHFRTTNFNIFAIIRTSKWFFGWCQFLSDQIYESTVVRPINGNQSYILSYLPALHIVSKIGAKWIFWKPLDFFKQAPSLRSYFHYRWPVYQRAVNSWLAYVWWVICCAVFVRN